MLPTRLLMWRYRGEEVVPKRLEPDAASRALADEVIAIFVRCRGRRRAELDEGLAELEGESTDYRVKRGLAHLLERGFSEFETVSPLEPPELRRRAFARSARLPADPASTRRVLAEIAAELSEEHGREVASEEVERGLYADLRENEVMTGFDAPTADTLLHRYNLAQVQGVLYRAQELVITAHRNVPGEYKQLFRYLKLFGLMTTIEGDADHGFTITIDGPASLFGPSTRYGVDLAKFLPALLHVSRWSMRARLLPRKSDRAPEEARLTLDPDGGLVSHYKRGQPFDSILEEAFAKRWQALDTPWRLEREVDLLPLPGSVMVPDFRLVHPDGRSAVFEIVGYWRPEYLRKKFEQVRRSGRNDIVLAISERLNLDRAGVRLEGLPARVVWFKGRIDPQTVLETLEG